MKNFILTLLILFVSAFTACKQEVKPKNDMATANEAINKILAMDETESEAFFNALYTTETGKKALMKIKGFLVEEVPEEPESVEDTFIIKSNHGMVDDLAIGGNIYSKLDWLLYDETVDETSDFTVELYTASYNAVSGIWEYALHPSYTAYKNMNPSFSPDDNYQAYGNFDVSQITVNGINLFKIRITRVSDGTFQEAIAAIRKVS